MADKKVIAVHVIHRTLEPGQAKTPTSPAKKPVIQEIKEGTAFLVSEDEYAELGPEGAGAVRLPNDDEKGLEVDPLISPAADDLDGKSVKDLKEIASSKGLTTEGVNKKADLIALIRGSDEPLV